jgi:hypothetical protein
VNAGKVRAKGANVAVPAGPAVTDVDAGDVDGAIVTVAVALGGYESKFGRATGLTSVCSRAALIMTAARLVRY